MNIEKSYLWIPIVILTFNVLILKKKIKKMKRKVKENKKSGF
jgi:hypothetical protein